METNQLLLTLAARYNLEIKMVDVKGAYLNSKLTEEIYMKQPEGFGDGTAHIFKLHKTIYGLHQSGKVWNERSDKQFQKINFSQLLSDQCVYIQHGNWGIIIISVHIDEMTIYASYGNLITEAEKEMEEAFKISRLGDIKQLLGIEIHRDRDAHKIAIYY
jgi:hypothetical protein